MISPGRRGADACTGPTSGEGTTLLQTVLDNRQPRENRRRFQRAPLHLPVSFREVTGASATVKRGLTLDVSRSGVRFHSGDFVPARAFLAFDLTLPNHGSCRARGRVVWSREAPGSEQWEIGAAFLRPDADADAALAEALLFSA